MNHCKDLHNIKMETAMVCQTRNSIRIQLRAILRIAA